MTRAYTMDLDRVTAMSEAFDIALGHIRGVLSDLDDRVDTLRGEWSGEASAAYARAHREWLASIETMAAVLGDTAAAAVNAVERHRNARAEVAALWS